MPKFCLLISNSNREIILSTPPICKIIRDPSRSRRNMWKKWRSSTCDKKWSNKSNHRTFDVLSFDWKLDSHESCGIESWLLISSVWPQLWTMLLTIYLWASLHSVLGPEKHNESNCIIVCSILHVLKAAYFDSLMASLSGGVLIKYMVWNQFVIVNLQGYHVNSVNWVIGCLDTAHCTALLIFIWHNDNKLRRCHINSVNNLIIGLLRA